MNGKRVMKTKKPVALVALLVLLCCTVAGTLAYLVDKTPEVKNTFEPAKVTTAVDEKFDGTTKSEVKIKNTGNIPAYIRVAVVANWIDEDGNVYGGETPVEGTNYTKLDPQNGWFQASDGYFYYPKAVAAQGETPVLFSTITQSGAPEGCHLQLTILADGIQSEPTSTVASVWTAIQVDTNGNLTAKN